MKIKLNKKSPRFDKNLKCSTASCFFGLLVFAPTANRVKKLKKYKILKKVLDKNTIYGIIDT